MPSDAPPPADTPSAYPPSALDAATTSCTEPSDCVVVELGCCDACNGGFAVAVNTASAAQVRADHAQDCGEGMACTEMACPDWVVTCDDGTCASERGTFDE